MQLLFNNRSRRGVYALILVGVFLFVSPLSVFAASQMHASMTNDVSFQEEALCLAQGCAHQHQSCEEHCFQQSQDHHVDIAAPTFLRDAAATVTSVVSEPIVVPEFVGVWLSLGRSPPALQLLRSVIKLE